MANSPRKVGFVLASTDHGMLIVNRFDYRMIDANEGYGVGWNVLERSSYDASEVDLVYRL